ncbi:MAG: formate--phosphoribosylaminoimidazolecarboxamide ligase [Candidatus Aenigmarchaeota archaeon]|nr:formate--phosphoribosylaminoimidazolecarboxamide ligase [Candidatus Aenigmarchaeota archaeon]
MITKEDIRETLKNYDKEKLTIATICSHSALQIFFGAKQEGFKTLGIYNNDLQKKTYESFQSSTPDEFLKVSSWKDILDEKFQEQLMKRNVIIIPHGSFVEYVGSDNLLNKFTVPMFGNRRSLEWEADRGKQKEWLEKNAGLEMPKEYARNELTHGKLYFVKFGGAKGGKGFFKIRSAEQLDEEIEKIVRLKVLSKTDVKSITIQDYIPGSRYYHHFFFSPLSANGWKINSDDKILGGVTLMGIDRRDETNIDDLHRTGLNPSEMREIGIMPSYSVAGNTPLIARESQLPKIFDLADKAVKASIKLFPPGMVGPFCIETFFTPEMKYITFEISCRIVAGTNLYPSGSPYTVYAYGDSALSTGKRIAQELKTAIKTNQLEKIIY